MTYLTREKYESLVKKYKGGHWTPETIDQRWDYHSRVVELVRSLNIKIPGNVLEMGTMGVSCVENSDTIDYLERWDFPGKSPTYVHDSRVTPWPIADKKYEIFIALRVFQHLTPSQMEATREAMRIARNVIIVVPDVYKNKAIPDSKGITYKEFVNFLDGIHPNLYFPIRNEFFYYWDVEKPSKLDIETVMHRTCFDDHQALTSQKQERSEKKSILEKYLNTAKSFIRKGINFFRKIVIFRAERDATIHDGDKQSQGNTDRHIEFIGPAGIGKSTIYAEVKKKAVGNWFYRENLSDILGKDGGGDGAELYLQLLHSKIDHLDRYNHLPSYERIRLISFFSNILLRDLAMSNNDPSSRKFLLDEGLCHNFSEELIDLSDSDLKMLMAKRAFVFVQARDSKTIVDRIRKRESETGRKVAYHVGLDDNALIDLSETSSSLFNVFIDRVESLGVPVCKIFAEDDIQNQVGHVLDFEKRFVL